MGHRSNGGRLGIASKHRNMTGMHSGAARRRRRRIVDLIHATSKKGLGDSMNGVRYLLVPVTLSAIFMTG